ncbi:DNA mismatch repair endonuclease MutL [Jeotgalibacillus soli]|uniref:DNA mismatch repair protein MutL n=1 Tax=Jeotgalibacillus soli TaxID=889306 RepID=A0A0C2VLU1_9BACL|nr:DNA mismatch repair endonuclease MutL [Jeotgalibacillus soli]KIL44973.1 DNA mismatch repair protein MutL [Jeotgalibacillus soli]
MGKIRQLSEALSNKIAAGEVVERPASVVKELIENAVDANATIVEIELEEAGLSSIRVMDNGNGMETDDVKTAFLRHATSKIQDEHDLFRIRTLGFRGEALPSIASVSHIDLTTSTGDAGSHLVLHGGEVKRYEPAAARRGTDIKVTDLFYNTPARLKYLKTINTELGNVTDIVNRLALSHPEVSFRLKHNQRLLLQTNGKGDVRQVLAAIYGMNLAKTMIPFQKETLDFHVSGYASLPEVTRASRNYLSIMINGRFIRNYAIGRAIQEGYHTLLPIGRYPVVLLSITMDPILVDVNVHPSKQEVRFSKEQELTKLITEALRDAFRARVLIPSSEPKKKERVQLPSEQTELSFGESSVKEKNRASASYKEALLPPDKMKTLYEPPTEMRETPPAEWNQQEITEALPAFEEAESPFLEQEFERREQSEDQLIEQKAEPESRVPMIYAIGQMHGTYILAQNDRGLYIVDQHAAQERIKYEFFREKVGQVEPELQELLMPMTLDFSTDDYIKIQEHRSSLEEVGVFLEEFGLNSFIVRSYPTWFPKDEEKDIIEDMIEQVLDMKKVDVAKLREEAAILMSCKRSIKANHYLRLDDMQQLLNELRTTEDPFTCPHGRPIIVHYTAYELEKMFKRVM